MNGPTYAMLGHSRAIREVFDEARLVCGTGFNVLLTGESGVGKKMLAQFIHDNSPRRHRRMLSLNCAEVAKSSLKSKLFGHARGPLGERSVADRGADGEGSFEIAQGSTLLLHEVGELDLDAQAFLLRRLERREVQQVGSDDGIRTADPRIISTSVRDLLRRASDQAFRLDLFYRLNVAHLQVPALRDRRDDVPLLMRHYLETMSEHFRLPLCHLDAAAMSTLEAYSWPGNVRELRDVAERLAVMHSGRVVSVSQLPATILNERGPASPISSPAPLAITGDSDAKACYEQITQGLESFWTVVYEPFLARNLTRLTVREIVARGLLQTNGSYKALTRLFNMPPTDHKRFLSFLQQHNCHPRPQASLHPSSEPRARLTAPSVPRKEAV